MQPKFKYNQFIVKKTREVTRNVAFGGISYYSLNARYSYGVFKVTPYVRKDVEGNNMEFDITYKVRLIPVGKNADKFCEMDYYTSDLRDVPEEMIFDDENLAQKFVDEFPI